MRGINVCGYYTLILYYTNKLFVWFPFLFVMLWSDGKLLFSMGEAVEEERENWCYFCNSRDHIGRECELQNKVIRPELLTEDIISQWSESAPGNSNEG